VYFSGVAYVDFSSEKDLNDAMRRNKSFISKLLYWAVPLSKLYQ
jgi:hypothetical protein